MPRWRIARHARYSDGLPAPRAPYGQTIPEIPSGGACCRANRPTPFSTLLRDAQNADRNHACWRRTEYRESCRCFRTLGRRGHRMPERPADGFGIRWIEFDNPWIEMAGLGREFY